MRPERKLWRKLAWNAGRSIAEMQTAIDSVEFREWLWAESRGELLDDYSRFGMVAAAVMNSGFRYPKTPVGSEDFRPKFETAEDRERKQVEAMDRLTKPVDYSEFIWQT